MQPPSGEATQDQIKDAIGKQQAALVRAKLRSMMQSFAARGIGRRDPSRKVTTKALQVFERILEATIDCLESEGYINTNLSRIADRANIKRAAVQYYFNSTEEALSAAVEYLHLVKFNLFEIDILTAPGPHRLDQVLYALVRSEDNRYSVARAELLAAFRTNPALKSLADLNLKAREGDQERLWEMIEAEAKPDDHQLFNAIYDMWSCIHVGICLGLVVDPKRIEKMLEIARTSTYHLWNRANPQEEAKSFNKKETMRKNRVYQRS